MRVYAWLGSLLLLFELAGGNAAGKGNWLPISGIHELRGFRVQGICVTTITDKIGHPLLLAGKLGMYLDRLPLIGWTRQRTTALGIASEC